MKNPKEQEPSPIEQLKLVNEMTGKLNDYLEKMRADLRANPSRGVRKTKKASRGDTARRPSPARRAAPAVRADFGPAKKHTEPDRSENQAQ